jgi:Lon protease-like protein
VILSGEGRKGRLMLSRQEQTERARAGGHALWAKLREELGESHAAQEHRLAAEQARRRLAVLRAQRAVADAQRAADDAAASLAEVTS